MQTMPLENNEKEKSLKDKRKKSGFSWNIFMVELLKITKQK